MIIDKLSTENGTSSEARSLVQVPVKSVDQVCPQCKLTYNWFSLSNRNINKFNRKGRSNLSFSAFTPREVCSEVYCMLVTRNHFKLTQCKQNIAYLWFKWNEPSKPCRDMFYFTKDGSLVYRATFHDWKWMETLRTTWIQWIIVFLEIILTMSDMPGRTDF